MKKTAILFLFFLGGLPVWAQSTCETRVDAHQKATTNQRVNYCLMPNDTAEEDGGPRLVFSSVDAYVIPQQPVEKPMKVTAEKGSFDGADIEVTHSFVQTRQFPKWSDGRVSEQYKREFQEAMSSGPETAQEAISHTECEPEEPDTEDAGVWFEPTETNETNETDSGIQVRQNKPGRRWVKRASTASVPAAERTEDTTLTEEVYADEENSYAPATSYEPETAAVTAEINSATEPANSSDFAADDYSYAPADYGVSATPAAAPETEDSQEPAVHESAEIPVGEYEYAPAD